MNIVHNAEGSATQIQVDKLLSNLASLGRGEKLSRRSYERICEAGFRGENVVLAAIASELAVECQPITLRGLFYRIVSTGYLPSTDKTHYNRVGGVLKRLRRAGIIPYQWIVDSLRSTEKPSSWSGLTDFTDTVRTAYRKDFWHHLDDYVHIICEKDAISGTIAPVTREFDVRLSPIRGYISDSFAHEIGAQWREIEKPIHAYYLGDFDPSGFDLERDLRAKLTEHSGRWFEWERLAVLPTDFEDQKLIPLAPKKSDKRCRKFIQEHGSQCAEVDAIDPTELRRRVRAAITRWVPNEQWERLQTVERLERETFASTLATLGASS